MCFWNRKHLNNVDIGTGIWKRVSSRKQFLFCTRDVLRAAGALNTCHLPEMRYCSFWKILLPSPQPVVP